MNRVLSIAERNATASPAAPIVCPALTNTIVLPNQVVEPRLIEISGRYIQNTGANACYYAIGQECSPDSYHGILAQYAQLDCSSHRLPVYVYSTGGTTIAPLVIYRNDLGRNNTKLPA